MKDLPPRPEPPQALITLPRELRLIQVGDGELRDAPDGDRRHLVRARSARRRLFVDDDELADEEGDAGGSGGAGTRRRRLAEPLLLYELEPEDAADKMAAEEAAAAARRWNFDFQNERPLQGQWQWEKVGDVEGDDGNENGDRQSSEPADGSHSPQR